MNILLTSVGRRAYMVKYFKEALGKSGQVHVSNSDDLTVAFHYADHSVITPLIYDDEYIPFLLEYCKANKIDVLLSLFDIDLLVLSQNKDRFAQIGTKVIVSDPGLITVCNDKWKTYEYLKNNGFHVPKTYLSLQQVLLAIDRGELSYPVIVKPRFGCGSIAMSVAEDEMALLYYFRRNARTISRSYLKFESASVPQDEQILYQECLQGQEYGADIINDLNGNLCNVIVKKKIAMRAGETDIAEVVDDPSVKAECERLGMLTGHIANMDCDVFLVDGKPYVLEMNARFGGGYPFSHMAGCNLPEAIIEWCSGHEINADLLSAETGKVGYKELCITEQIKR
ncbi:MAG: ATP-grasp domain-containing protein [Clostridia bacterium]|nr:ATP-grasp domain-containing protein [Clostridia bacterium]